MRTATRFLVGTVLAAIALTSSYTAAQAQRSACGDREKMVAHLAKKYEEQPIALGLQTDGRVLEVFSSKTSGSWTILVSTPDGFACLASSGEAWQPIEKTAASVDDPAEPGA